MTALQPDYFDRPLAEVDPEVAEAIGHELERQQRTLEMIASENFVPQAVLECQGSRPDQQVRRGVPGQALLRRLRVHRHHRAARDRPGEVAVRRRARERPAARGRAGQHGRLPRAAHAGRPDHGPEPPARRSPQPRHEDQRVRPAVRHRPVRGLGRPITGSTWTRSSASPRSTARSCCWRAGRPTRACWTSRASARSPTRSARC